MVIAQFNRAGSSLDLRQEIGRELKLVGGEIYVLGKLRECSGPIILAQPQQLGTSRCQLGQQNESIDSQLLGAWGRGPPVQQSLSNLPRTRETVIHNVRVPVTPCLDAVNR
ncbi:hypothetical protein CDO25_14520 [Sinorhizobium meliloti]|nr:hypothetical protein CDO25_14520 [Sinorhizobium meliloti]